MSVFVIVFMVIASLFALATLGYVTIDIVHEIRSKDKAKGEEKEAP